MGDSYVLLISISSIAFTTVNCATLTILTIYAKEIENTHVPLSTSSWNGCPLVFKCFLEYSTQNNSKCHIPPGFPLSLNLSLVSTNLGQHFKNVLFIKQLKFIYEP
jgi:hypothetical protein